MIQKLRELKWKKIIQKSGLFDAKYYLFTYPDVRKQDMNPIMHYIKYGAKERRNPSKDFDTKFYLTTYKDIDINRINPLVHYILYGKSEGRKIIDLKVSTNIIDNTPIQNVNNSKNNSFIGKIIKEIAIEPSLIKKTYLSLMNDGLSLTLEKIKSKLTNKYYHPVLSKSTNIKTLQYYNENLKQIKYEPKVSIIVPNYNHARFLNKRIDSILNQTYQNFELLLLDDCSTDESRVILENYANNNPSKIKTLFNEKNAGNVFKQWRKGIENSHGDLIWICESDDYCENDFLEKLVEQFKNPGVNIAFGRIQFCDLENNFVQGLDNYREGAERGIWGNTLVRPAKQWFCNGFGVNNVIANVGGCVFKRQIFESKIWEEAQNYKILGDWFLYAHIANGGLIAYEPTAVAYFRQHGSNTSVSSFSTAKYYEEHFSLMKTLKSMWKIPNETIDKFYSKIEFQYRHFKCENHLEKLKNYVNIEELKNTKRIKRHVLVGILAFQHGGGELFPIVLANELQKQGNIVSLFVLNMNNINQDLYNLVDKKIAIYDSKFVEAYGTKGFLEESGVSLINSHMISIDMFFLVRHKVFVSYFATLHGSYEACDVPRDVIKTISEGVTHWIYTADRNLTALQFLDIPQNKLTKLPNAMPIDDEPFPKSRAELGIKDDTVVFTLVARGIKRKGWRAAIEAFLKLKQRYPNIHLLLCGDGEETQKYKKIYNEHPKITFLGYQSKIHGLYKISDCAIVPTRFEGESYPLCIIQALQVGLPVIGTDVGEIKSMLTSDGGDVAGIVLPHERDTELFINHLKNAMSEMMLEEKREEFSKISKELAKKYEISNLAKRYVEVFEKKIKKQKTLYIHIGWPKTGTSAIQKFLVDNFEILQSKYDLFYPDFGRWNDGSHHNIAFALRKNPYCEMKSESEQVQYLKELKEIILSSNCRNILLSSECFNLYDNYIFKELFCDDFEIKIICYLRNQDQYIDSIYGQNVRDPFFKEKQSFRQFLDTFKEKLFYSKTLEQWEKVTHKDNFIIKHYSFEKFVNGNIVDDFLSALNIKPNKNDFKYLKSTINDSYTKNALEYKRLLNTIMPKQDVKLVQILQLYSKKYPEEKISFLTNEEKNKFNEIFLEDNRIIQNNYQSNFILVESSIHIANNTYRDITDEKIKEITNFISKNDTITFQAIKNDCLAYQAIKDYKIQQLINSVLSEV